MSVPRNPQQPLVTAVDGCLRFKENKIVRDLYEFSRPKGLDLNRIAVGDYTDDDRRQFAELIGYSHSGYADLHYVRYEHYEAAERLHLNPELTPDQAKVQALESELEHLRACIKKAIDVLEN